MKKLLVNYGVIAIFYLIVVLGVLFLCTSNVHRGSAGQNFTTSNISSK